MKKRKNTIWQSMVMNSTMRWSENMPRNTTGWERNQRNQPLETKKIKRKNLRKRMMRRKEKKKENLKSRSRLSWSRWPRIFQGGQTVVRK